MSKLKNRIDAFVKLGNFLRYYSENNSKTLKKNLLFDDFSEKLSSKISLSIAANGWFTQENIIFALKHWGSLLTEQKLNEWLNAYPMERDTTKMVAIVMAGNIPLVGFHDFMSVLLSGNRVMVKQSASDKYLLPVLISFLQESEASFKDKIQIADSQLKDFDAVIATGSDNTARYFEYYFSKKPNIIRKNRNSIAVLKGDETNQELSELGEDIFRYFGLGCRNVSKIFVPKNYNFDAFFNAIFGYKDIINHHKYANNYDYNKAVYLMSLFELKDNGFFILKEDKSYSSPIATLFYEYYDSTTHLEKLLEEHKDKIQCIVSSKSSQGYIPFGKSQKPALNTYADGVDTIDFLLKI